MLHLHHPDNTRCHPIEPKPDPGTEPDTYPPGRRCPHEHPDGSQCITILHRYHRGPWCHAHEHRHLAEQAAMN